MRIRSKHRQVFRASVRRLKYWKKKSLVYASKSLAYFTESSVVSKYIV